MAILICGGAGYIGSHINKELNALGYETVVFDNLSYGHIEAVKWGRFVKGDLENRAEIEAVFTEYDIEAVFHFAAFAYVGESVKEPEKYYYNNISNTLNLLSVMRRYDCKKIIFSSTCATYGEPKKIPITEQEVQNPINPYGKTKLYVENILKDYDVAYGLKFIALRYFNAAGADPEGEIGESHEPETHIIPLVLDAASGKRDCIKIYGNNYDTRDGSCIRDYIHVSDLAQAHILALKKLEKGSDSDFYNLGNENGTSVFEIVRAAEEVTKKKISVSIVEKRPGDPAVLIGCADKARKELGWLPKFGDIETIIRHAWEWHEHATY